MVSRRAANTNMHAWLYVLAVLAILQGVTQVASTGEQPSASTSPSSLSTPISSTSSSNELPENRRPSAGVDSVEESESTMDQDSLERPMAGELHLQLDPVDPQEESDDDDEFSDSDNSLDISGSTSSHGSHSSDSDNNRNRKLDPEMLVEVEKNLQSLFGLSNRPKIDRSKVVIPEAMRQLYAQIMGHELVDSVNVPKEGLSTGNANTVRSFTHEESHIDDRFKHHHRFRFMFNVSDIPLGEKLRAAELTLNRDAIDHPRARFVQHQILVYDILRPGVKGKRAPSFLLIDSKSVKINETGSVSVDVMPAVQRWRRYPKQNYGLFIQVTSKSKRKPQATPEHHHVRLRRSIDESHDKWSHKQPLLFTYTDDGRHKKRPIRDAIDTVNRARRAPSRNRRRKNGSEACQRRPLYVDFSDVGWSDWIVAPPGYEAYYCHGDCPFPIPDHLNTTNHAIVQTLVNSINPSLAPRACCVPTQLSSISMLYLNEKNKVVLKNYQDMTVVGCGCR